MKKSIVTLIVALLATLGAYAHNPVHRVLFIGDSMTGWLAERMEAYGEVNNFEVTTVVWDGSTLSKWVNTGKIPAYIAQYKPDVVMICLGLNELLARDPGAQMGAPLQKLEKQLGSTPFVWIGPPVWPGKGTGEAFNNWMAAHMGAHGHYFNSQSQKLARQSATNPHPTRAACSQWMDAIMHHLPAFNIGFPEQIQSPAAGAMKRGKVFIYRRMKQTL